MSVDFKVQGLRELERTMQQLPDRVAKNSLTSAVRAGARTIGQAIREEAPRGRTGNLKRGIKWQSSRSLSGRGRVTFSIFVDYSIAPHAHLIEFGTGPRYHSTGKYVGQVTPNPFIRRGVERSSQAAVKALYNQLKSRILGDLRKTGRI